MELENKTAVVCGSTQGIGYAIAKLFAANGYNLLLITHDEEKLKKVKDEINKLFTVKVEYLVADFNDSDEVQEVVDSFLRRSDIKIDILVNNVRGPMPAVLFNSKKTLLREVFERHIISNHIITNAVIKNFLSKKNTGRIINICDNTSIAPYPSLGLSAIRAAEISWALTLALELAPYGITVNNILPGPTDTPGLEKIMKILAKEQNVSYEAKKNEIINSLPMKRFALPEEIANVALFIASEKASYITGSNIKVDGGFNVNI